MALSAVRLSSQAALVLLVLAVLGAAREGREILRAAEWNRDIAAGTTLARTADGPPEVAFARAHELATRGDIHAALAAYRAIRDEDAPALANAARYNSANLLVAQALALDAATLQGQRIPYLELAKETYREVLRADPAYWAARFNLERTLRLLPDPEPGDEVANDPQPGAERAVTTMRGFSPGLP